MEERKRWTGYQWAILGLLFFANFFAYMDRVNMSVVMPTLIKEFHLTKAEAGWLLSAFNWAFVLSLLKDDKLLALAVGSAEPLASPVQVPTARSAGVDYEYSTWYGFLAPAKTPPAILAVLGVALAKANDNPDVRAKVAAQGISPATKERAAFDAHIRADMQRLAPVLKDIASKMTD